MREAGIALTISGIRKSTDADIIVVSDGSADSTADEAKAQVPMVIELPFNLWLWRGSTDGFQIRIKKRI